MTMRPSPGHTVDMRRIPLLDNRRATHMYVATYMRIALQLSSRAIRHRTPLFEHDYWYQNRLTVSIPSDPGLSSVVSSSFSTQQRIRCSFSTFEIQIIGHPRAGGCVNWLKPSSMHFSFCDGDTCLDRARVGVALRRQTSRLVSGAAFTLPVTLTVTEGPRRPQLMPAPERSTVV